MALSPCQECAANHPRACGVPNQSAAGFLFFASAAVMQITHGSCQTVSCDHNQADGPKSSARSSAPSVVVKRRDAVLEGHAIECQRISSSPPADASAAQERRVKGRKAVKA